MSHQGSKKTKKKRPKGGGGGGDKDKDNTNGFKKTKSHHTTSRMKLHEYATETLGAGNMVNTVRLPKGEDLNEWLAVNTVDFFNEISLLYGLITEFCTKDSCPVMSAGQKYEYLWMDGIKYKKPHKCSAPEYIDLLMTWVEDQINDPKLFPVEDGKPFPKKFKNVVKTMLKRLFRVYGHIYCSADHIKQIVSFQAEAHLNTCFKHFIYFVKEFKLVDDRELAPCKDTINHMLAKDKNKKGTGYVPKYKYKSKPVTSKASTSTNANANGNAKAKPKANTNANSNSNANANGNSNANANANANANYSNNSNSNNNNNANSNSNKNNNANSNYSAQDDSAENGN